MYKMLCTWNGNVGMRLCNIFFTAYANKALPATFNPGVWKNLQKTLLACCCTYFTLYCFANLLSYYIFMTFKKQKLLLLYCFYMYYTTVTYFM